MKVYRFKFKSHNLKNFLYYLLSNSLKVHGIYIVLKKIFNLVITLYNLLVLITSYVN